MMETVMEVKVDEFLAHKIEDIVKRGTFKSKGEFVKSAVEDMIRRWETQELTTGMDKFAEDISRKHPDSVSEAVLRAREEEDEIL